MKSLKLANVILKIYFAHLFIGLIILGPNWYIHPTTDHEISMATTSEILLFIFIFFYLFPLLSMYESAVKNHYAKKKFEEIIKNSKVEIMSQEELENRWAETEQCDCDRCKEIREKIAAEKADLSSDKK